MMLNIVEKTFKILIANRGEISIRIIRAAKLLGFKTVLVFLVETACVLQTLYHAIVKAPQSRRN